MADEQPPEQTRPTSKQRGGPIASELLRLSGWQRWLVSLFLVMAAVGGVMWTHATLTSRGEVRLDDPPVFLSDQPEPSRGFVGDAGSVELEQAEEPGLPWHGQLGGWLAKLGISFAVGVVVGVFFRSFLKTVAAVTAVAVAAVVGLSYFEIIDVDFTTMRDNYGSAAEATRGFGSQLKDLVLGRLPSATAALGGFVVGFLRR